MSIDCLLSDPALFEAFVNDPANDLSSVTQSPQLVIKLMDSQVMGKLWGTMLIKYYHHTDGQYLATKHTCHQVCLWGVV